MKTAEPLTYRRSRRLRYVHERATFLGGEMHHGLESLLSIYGLELVPQMLFPRCT